MKIDAKMNFGNLARVFEKLGLRLLDPESIRARGKARAETRVRRAQARHQESLIDAQLKKDKERISTGAARATRSGRLVSVSKTAAIEHQVATDIVTRGGRPQKGTSDLVMKQHLQNQSVDSLERFLKMRTTGRLAEEISEHFTDDEDAQTKIPDDFINSWKEGVERSDDDQTLRLLWARLLLGECESPGKFSKRTITTLHLLSSDEAKTLAKVGPLVTCGGFIAREDDMLMDFNSIAPYKVFSGQTFLKDADLSYSAFSALETIGMISGSSSLGHHNVIQQMQHDQGRVWLLDFCRKKLLIGYTDKPCEPIKIPSYLLTHEGRAILSLGDFMPNNEYVSVFSRLLKDRGAIRVTLADIISSSSEGFHTAPEMEI